ncbi:MAG TPA: SsrA-binding protein SmpB [Ignavibacteriales bacterium]|nr:SsrA-binding protein SmpB [Ignavibacteriales bacterium]HOL81637.1 SsrA-binding protein SmpB [Ignavibacteriales bacterium]HOM65182.1 SsrA-binding protein SmpB [Ignavibacteriales bacterium]HPD66906.1 SsrA-binding protein SmpB [Ignavibacteriales bacterium]HPP33751.1 SsrA-binding protein SmpB [Ignavibacteriales bacterium]
MKQENTNYTVVVNKKAYHDYFILQTWEAGICLVGTEVKSLRAKKANISDAYATVKNGEVFLINAHINEYEQGNRFNHDPRRDRKLLLNRSEIRKISSKIKEKGFTLVPLKIYFKNGKAKVEIALAKGKHTYDKRESIADRDFMREQSRKIKI